VVIFNNNLIFISQYGSQLQEQKKTQRKQEPNN